jgi:hypothetical protein
MHKERKKSQAMEMAEENSGPNTVDLSAPYIILVLTVNNQSFHHQSVCGTILTI